MPSTFPGAIDNFTDPLANSSLASPSHAGQHSDLNDAVEKIEQYMGLVKVIPTAATNGTINATTGTVTVGNAVASVSVTCFSALYDNYRIIYTGGNASVGSNLNMTINGSTGSTYLTTGLFMTPGTATINAFAPAATSIWVAGPQNTTRQAIVIDLFRPFAVEQTFGRTSGMGTSSYYDFGLADINSASSTSFTFLAGAGTLTGGSIRVYGYRN